MKEHEIKKQASRISEYRKLESIHNEINNALKKITEDWEEGPCKQNPFTGNTRESRQVTLMSLNFSATRGGAAAVSMTIPDLNIEAWELGRAIETMLRAKLSIVQKAMDEI